MKRLNVFFKIDKASRLLTFLGVSLVFAILFLAIYFFQALYENQVNTINHTLNKQIELAGKETEKSFNSMYDDMVFLINNLEPWTYESAGNEPLAFEGRVQRIFNNYREIIDTLTVDFPNHRVSFHFDSKNFFIKEVKNQDRDLTSEGSPTLLLKNTPKKLTVQVHLSLNRFAVDQLSNYYLGANSSKFMVIDELIIDLVEDSYFKGFALDQVSMSYINETLGQGLKGKVAGEMVNDRGEKSTVWIHFYPIRLNPLEKSAALIFIHENRGTTSTAFSTYIYIILALFVLIVFVFLILYQFNRSVSASNESLAKSAREVEELFNRQNLLLQESNGFIYFQNERNEMTSVGEEVSTVLGYTKDEFCQNFRSYIAPESVDQLTKEVEKSIQQKQELFKIDFFFYKKNGEKIRVKLFERLLFDEQGNYQGTVGIITDIDEQYKTEQERVRSEERLRIVLESLPDLIFIYDYEGNFLDYYVQDESLLLESPAASIGKNVSEVLPDEYGTRVHELIQKAKDTGKIQRIDLELQVPVGAKIFETRIFKLDDDRMISIARDVTAQKVWEKGLQEAVEAADQANRAKSEFLANMSHEIRTPMNALLGIVSLLETTELDDQQVLYLNLLKSSGKNLSGIINDILDYSKIDSGAMSLRPVVFNFKEEIQDTFQVFTGLLKEKNIQFSVDFVGDIPEFVEVDREKLVQVLTNIIGNAIKFTNQGGVVHVQLSCEEIIEDTVMLLFEVTDTGIGIPKEKIPELTQPFYQLDGSNTREYQGTGLGLAISNKILELMGGELQITSELGKGSKFKFSVFAKAIASTDKKDVDQAKGIPPKLELIPEFGVNYPLNILIAEDNHTNVIFMSMLMEQLGYDVDFVSNGLEAVEAVKKKQYDFVFMDIQMPKLNGLEATVEILKLNLDKPPLIYGLSANAFNEDREKAIQLGMNGYLAKPVDIEIIAKTLHDVYLATKNS